MHLITSGDADEEMIYQNTKTIWENRQSVAEQASRRPCDQRGERGPQHRHALPSGRRALLPRNRRLARSRRLSAPEQSPTPVAAGAAAPGAGPARLESLRRALIGALGVGLCFFVLFEVNFNLLLPQSSLAVFVGSGLLLCFLAFPVHSRLASKPWLRCLDLVLGLGAAGSLRLRRRADGAGLRAPLVGVAGR